MRKILSFYNLDTIFSLSGLTPVMAAMIDYVMKPFRSLKITTTEFAALQAIMLFDPGIVEYRVSDVCVHVQIRTDWIRQVNEM
jgi:hypothetical protein